MDIRELESFKLSDAVKFHDKLNPRLWRGNRLDPAVKKQLLIIAKDFVDELGIKDLDVEDVTVSGSNAAYSYTPHSDLDLHILVDMSKLPADEIYRELFQAKKTLYNDAHDITVHGVPVELYVQDSKEPVVSLGEYSLLKDRWTKLPTKRRANLDQRATKAKYEQLKELVELALKVKDISRINTVLKMIKRYRKAGLEKGGEFGPENLAFKVLRKQGGIQKLYDLRNKLHSEELTIENMYMVRESVSDKQAAVLKIQKHLNKKYGANLDLDGILGPLTIKSINKFMPRAKRGLADEPNKTTDVQGKNLKEVSGYIPSEKEKNDPRFKTALTVDIKPNTMKKDASKFGNKISRAGIPPQARADGKIG